MNPRRPRPITASPLSGYSATAPALMLSIFLVSVTACANTSVPESRANDLAAWRESLRQAGATAQEISDFDTLVERQSPETVRGWRDDIAASPDFFEQYLIGARIANSEAVPRAIFTDNAPVLTCDDVRNVSIPETIISQTEIASDGSCRVTAIVTHADGNPIHVFVALPMTNWNGRFMGTGGGGFAGGSTDNLNVPVTKGYAVATTDTGNPNGTAAFALDENRQPAWERIRNNAYIGIHDMTVVGQALTQAFYGKAARYSYFFGGSTGGQQALTEAQRYPQDYDGLLALYPAIARERYVPARLWPQVLMREADNFLSQEKLDFATAAAIAACSEEGAGSRVIENPLECDFDPRTLVGMSIGDAIFTEADARIVHETWEGPRGPDGRFLWWGTMRGADLSEVAGASGTPLAGRPNEGALDWSRYFLERDPNWDWRTLSRAEFAQMFDRSSQTFADIYGGDDPDLSAFRARGGKLLILHGFADPVVSPQATIDYYERVTHAMGGADRVSEFARLFLVPGADHGFNNAVPAPSRGEMIGALLRWVEEGRAPDQLIANRQGRNGETVETRTLRPYSPQPH